ncbi:MULTISPECIES: alpha/beta fold hydrolase [unclassified Streptomyces]|uniref:alpha/beta fold hydrolase n=1 Tax=unclassified Streptomyces TaxID=2593676 RepID=UPI00278BF655|nr:MULTISPECIES: alpha/beta hydrolase [unclassified Streptomyces]
MHTHTWTYAPYPEVTVPVAEFGTGTPVLLLHGAAGPDSVGDLARRLADRHHVIVPTHPGWNDTPRPDWFTGIDSLVECYLDLLHEQGHKDVAVIGNSMGGWVASETAVRDRGRLISELVLINAIGPKIEGHQIRTPGSGRPPGPPRPPADNGAPRQGPTAASMAALKAYAGDNMADPRLRTRLARLALPTLVLWGEQDTVVTPDFGRAYAAAIPAARFELVKDANHVPMREQPQTVADRVRAFLDDSRN